MIGNPFAARKAIYTALAANSTLCALIGGSVNPRIYQQLGAQGAQHPFVVIRSNAPQVDTQNVSAETIFSNVIFDVMGFDKGLNYDTLEAIQEQIDISLTPLSVDFGSNRIMSMTKLSAIDDSRTDAGITYVMAGVKYKATIR
jgi:hypothetical protein